ncbi:MAG: pantetheine-phosphate adenylyltransferase [Proteobacteria bacterium]|nr:pantetheine-phosphate adenylyltransferase [Pseudomonadota bacterium]
MNDNLTPSLAKVGDKPLRIALYPGTFDPITNGHVNIIERGLSLFDRIIVTIAVNAQKIPCFPLEQRMDMIRQCFPDSDQVSVGHTDGLIVDFALRHGAQTIIRGLRMVSDFEYEFQMALMNRRLERSVDTVFLMTGFRWFFISSSGIKDTAQRQGKITGLVPKHVERALREKFT